MTDVPPIEPVVVEEAGVGTLALEDASLSMLDLEDAITNVVSFGDVTDAVAWLDRAEAFGVKFGAGPRSVLLDNFYSAMVDGLETGAVEPREMGQALQWVLRTAKLTKFTAPFILSGELTALLLLYGATHGRTLRAPTRTQVKPTTTTVVVGPVGEGTNTPGGRMVEYGQAGLKRTIIKVPGANAATVKAINLAASTTYQNALTTMIRVANALTAQSEAAADLGTEALGAANAAYHHADERATALSQTLSTVTGIAQRLATAVRVLDGRIANVENELTAIRQGQPVTGTSPSPLDMTAIEAGAAGLVLSSGVLATKVDFNTLQAELDAQKAVTTGIATELQTSNVANLPTEIQTLDDCCAENAAITNPIRQGGATPSLLSGLGKLLERAAALFALLGIFDTVYAILDMDQAVTDTVQAAEAVAGWVDTAVASGTFNLSWADTIAGV